MTYANVVSTYNKTDIRNFSGDVFLLTYPSAHPGTDLTPVNVLKGFFGLIYADGQKKEGTLLTGISPWTILDENGISIDPKYKMLEVNTNQLTPPIPAGFYPESVEIDLTVCDPNKDKLAEMISALAGHKIVTAAGAAQSAQSGLMMGAQGAGYITYYTMIFRSPSKIAGFFDHLLIPKCYIDPGSLKIELNKKGLWQLKPKIKPVGDDYLADAGSTIPVWGYFEQTTAGHTA